MIEPEEALRTWLLADTTVAALIGTRMYGVKAAQQAARPYIVYRRIGGNPERHMVGAAAIAQARVQIDGIADHYDMAHQIADACRMRLDGFQGQILITPPSTYFYVRHLALQDSRDDFVDPTSGSDDGIYIASQDFLIFYVLPLPTL